jgi:hypothetical protein
METGQIKCSLWTRMQHSKFDDAKLAILRLKVFHQNDNDE